MTETFCLNNSPGKKYSLAIHLSAVLHTPRSEQLHASLFHAGLAACRAFSAGNYIAAPLIGCLIQSTREKNISSNIRR